jgi:branched-chain amino acid transport system permease protein
MVDRDALVAQGRRFLPVLAIIAVQQLVFPVSAGILVSGFVSGCVAALMAAGLSLVWRANRVVNFAQGDLGVAPATLGVLLVSLSGVSYWIGLLAGIATAIVLGLVVEMLIIRRFTNSARTVLTVATLGVSQLLAFISLRLPRLWGEIPTIRDLKAPFEVRITIGQVIFDGNDLLAVLVSVALLAALAVLLGRTSVGVLIRASADRSARAATLGVPVRRLQTLVWVIATVLSFVSVWLGAGIGGLSFGFGLSLNAILVALAAVVIGRMNDTPVIVVVSMALGMLARAIKSSTGQDGLVSPVIAAVVIVSMLAMKAAALRSERDESSSWRGSDVARDIPKVLAGLPEVRFVRWGFLALTAAALVAAPLVVSTRPALKLGEILIFATVGVSIVVLSGWSGQISLGQMALVGVGAAIAAWCQDRYALDPFLTLIVAAVAGGAVAVIIGLPALRLRGLFLAVSSLAMAIALYDGVFANTTSDLIPKSSFAGSRPAFLGRIRVDTPARLYYLALGVFLLCVLAATGIRRSRTGRALLALRDNEAGVEAYGISVTRLKLTAFALSGSMASMAGTVLTYHQGAFKPTIFEPSASLSVFMAGVVGGLTSLPGAFIGALTQRGAQVLPGGWDLLALSVGVLLVLLIVPQGLGGLVFGVRDQYLRWVAERRGIIVPSLTELGEPEALGGADSESEEGAHAA